MNVWTYMLIGFAVSAVLGLMRKPKATKGQTVVFPVFMAMIGIVGVIGFAVLAVLSYKDDGGFAIVVFLLFGLLSAWLIMAYVNCRISYDEKGFTARNFWGITRSYTYADITWLKGTRDVKLYVGDHVVRIDEMAIGKTEFLCYAESRYMRTHGGRGIPIEPPDGKKGFDLFNGNVENPGEFIAVYVILIGCILAMLIFVAFDSRPTKGEELSYSTIQVERYEVEDDDLWLYVEGEDLPFEMWGYATSLEDVDTFLQQCEAGASFTVGYVTYPNADEPYHKLHYVEDDKGMVYLTLEAAHREEMKNTKEILLVMGLLGLAIVLFIAASIYVGRHPDRVGPRVVKMFFKEGYVHMSANAKKER